MSYKTLQQLSSDIAQSVADLSSINDYLMIPLDEINSHHAISYPLCLVEPPESEIENINRAREEYDLDIYILDSWKIGDDDVIQYDLAVKQASELISKLLCQREGAYILSQKVSIERIQNIGSDRNIGVHMSVKLLAPSILSVENPMEIPQDGLILHYDLEDLSKVNYISGTKFNLDSLIEPSIPMTPKDNSSFPLIDKFNKHVTFDRGKLDSLKGQNLTSGAISTTSEDFSVFLKVQIPETKDNASESVIFTLKDSLNRIQGSLSIGALSSNLSVRFNLDSESFGDISSLIDRKGYLGIGLVNTGSESKVYVGFEEKTMSINSANALSSVSLSVGSDVDVITNSIGKHASMNFKELTIHDRALSGSEAKSLISKFMYSG
jgi:hypothetical protein